ncbi:hypothetical protein CEXT_207711 [Caerostris extrusa]|uniref:Uncharacterized protein n=1 Tax=Caerostris extrusa TaxID=172846 RepID=A0AAV4Q8B7_CAEEX|nr:hypothetical protein CEXT_207711 [Caerostris extrusa]
MYRKPLSDPRDGRYSFCACASESGKITFKSFPTQLFLPRPLSLPGEDEQTTKTVAGEAIFKVLIAHHKVFRTIDLHDNGCEY